MKGMELRYPYKYISLVYSLVSSHIDFKYTLKKLEVTESFRKGQFITSLLKYIGTQ